jgi:hypothetical protein
MQTTFTLHHLDEIRNSFRQIFWVSDVAIDQNRDVELSASKDGQVSHLLPRLRAGLIANAQLMRSSPGPSALWSHSVQQHF